VLRVVTETDAPTAGTLLTEGKLGVTLVGALTRRVSLAWSADRGA
jgi:hypothetical protein